jgi:palmitoyl-protein thioesterase
MMRIISELQVALPGVFIHAIRVGKTPDEDRKNSLFDSMDRQISEVCSQLAAIPELQSGFNAIGISQVSHINFHLFYCYCYCRVVSS